MARHWALAPIIEVRVLGGELVSDAVGHDSLPREQGGKPNRGSRAAYTNNPIFRQQKRGAPEGAPSSLLIV
jgi:hypothetical protein